MAEFQTIPSANGSAVPEHPLVAGGVQLIEAVVKLLQTRAAAPPADVDVRARRSARLKGLKQTCRALGEQNAWVASAVGACGCWGTDLDCPACAGRGRPGALPVDPAAFTEIIAPLVALRPDLFVQQPSADALRSSGGNPT